MNKTQKLQEIATLLAISVLIALMFLIIALMPKVKMELYSPTDSDFYEDNIAFRIGQTDFFLYTRDDGTQVILEEDMKWVLPKGTDVAKLKQELIEYTDYVVEHRFELDYSCQEWQNYTTYLINKCCE